MISYLLLLAAILCGVTSKPANITEDLYKNQTFGVSTHRNNTTKPNYEATSLDKEKLNEIESELEKNNTSIIYEDNENFQDQNVILPEHCNQDTLREYSYNYCGAVFHAEMQNISREDWCVLKSIIRPYNDLTQCLETVADFSGCFFPNTDIQDFFIYIHSTYFQDCTETERKDLIEDAPTSLVVALTIIPVSFIPVLVCLVLWKS
ncbi:receptor activity-modifying protein 1-like [Cyprinodon tularosa]|uniref:receptor activity-modifying protein 1-like n=1 Tax=Cyprinodon tularosa TaxID=77115 RepID=UPI0018E1FF8C|nr:receptor activity-modifying protein 1-like [Cyprinodon tularosa]